MSICVPAYNGAHLIPRALDFCLRQTYSKIEVVVVDDASTDETAEVINAYAAKDSRVKYYKNEKNLGLMRNFLRAFELAKGDLVQYLGCDDWLDYGFVEEKVKTFEKYPDAAFVSCGTTAHVENFQGGGYKLINRKSFRAGIYTSDHVFKNFYRDFGLIGNSSTVRKNDMLENLVINIPNNWGYEEFYRKGKVVDNIVYLNILSKYKFMYYSDKVFFNSLEHAGSASKLFGFNRKDISENVKSAHVDLVGFEHFYRTRAPQYLSRFRIFWGANVLSGAILDALLRRVSGSPIGALKRFFSSFTALEKCAVALVFPLHLARRVFARVRRAVK